ncbi:hypothetical protein [Kribbella sp. CA-294648]|jgi:hypothetical protein|uniref:hypothetical protein n=1 Tax=Kribbella sp. CA-294648 TaxID=3239948 RepID=UPI003D92CD78
MTGIVVLAVLALVVIAALEVSNRRNADGFGPLGRQAADDRDLARTKLDLLALGGAAEPFSHKPASTPGAVVSIRSARVFAHHGRHAA